LELAEPEGFVRVFIDEGVAVRDLLRLATARGIAGAYTRHVLAAFDGAAQPVSETKPASDVVSISSLLTSRELEILRLIAAGMRNQEIATQLFISTATVKRHIANIYNKLEATHRTDALKRASALNLL
jgi:LuxR family maltose regulon positive regulatory protein